LLTADFGSGYSGTNLRWFRQFYVEYPALLPVEIHHALRGKSLQGLSQGTSRIHHAVRDESPDVFKDPVVIEFLGLPASPKLVESELEQALINNLQAFLLELGRGFAFIARQQRITLDGDHFYIGANCKTICHSRKRSLMYTMSLSGIWFFQAVRTRL